MLAEQTSVQNLLSEAQGEITQLKDAITRLGIDGDHRKVPLYGELRLALEEISILRE